MSTLGNAVVGTGIGLAGSAISSVAKYIFSPRGFESFVADVTLEEQHEDVVTVTSHPVERGANMSDHAYRQPEKVTLKLGWSNASIMAFTDFNYVNSTYEKIVALQQSRVPFNILTGKRKYSNMLITRLSVMTDEKSENTLMATIEFTESMFVDTQTVAVGQSYNMANPQNNGATSQRGTVPAQSVSGVSFAQ